MVKKHSINEITRNLVENNPFILFGLDNNLLNVKACATHLQPKVEALVGKKVSIETIMLAIKNTYKTRRKNQHVAHLFKALSRMKYSIHSDVGELILPSTIRLKDIPKKQSCFYITSRLERYCTLITNDTEFIDEVKKIADVAAERKNLVFLRVNIHKTDVDRPGLLSVIMSNFSAKGISIIELISAYTEIGYVIKEKDVAAAVDCLREIIESAKVEVKQTEH